MSKQLWERVVNRDLVPEEVAIQQEQRQMFYKGSRFKDLRSGKEGTVQSLRDNELEQYYRLSDPTHYYYLINYDDGSFETYLGQHNMILLSR